MIKYIDAFLSYVYHTCERKWSDLAVNNENDLDIYGFMASREVCLSYPRLVVSVSSSLGCNSLQERFR